MDEALGILERIGVPRQDISVVAHSFHVPQGVAAATEHSDLSRESAAAGAGVGAAVGVAAGAVALGLTGFGSVLLLGPLAMTGGIMGGLVGAMSGWGIREDHANAYERKIHDGKWLIAVTSNPVELAQVYDQLRQQTAADEVHIHLADSSESPEISHS
jgi:hypothetical protein